ncbi:MAG: hypothetical protein AB1650_00360 [Candidatus Omnitrophota bacterium]
MFFWDIIAAMATAVLLTAIFEGGSHRGGLGDGALLFFFIIFLTAWAGGLWITPFGPAFFGIYWFPFLFFSLVTALLMAGLLESKALRTNAGTVAKEGTGLESVKVNVVFYWTLIFILVFWIIFGYLWL